MQKRITYVSPHNVVLALSVISAVGTLIFILGVGLLLMTGLSFAPAASNPEGQVVDVGRGFLSGGLFVPFIQFVFVYIFTFISVLLFNLLAKFTGGIKVIVSE